MPIDIKGLQAKFKIDLEHDGYCSERADHNTPGAFKYLYNRYYNNDLLFAAYLTTYASQIGIRQCSINSRVSSKPKLKFYARIQDTTIGLLDELVAATPGEVDDFLTQYIAACDQRTNDIVAGRSGVQIEAHTFNRGGARPTLSPLGSRASSPVPLGGAFAEYADVDDVDDVLPVAVAGSPPGSIAGGSPVQFVDERGPGGDEYIAVNGASSSTPSTPLPHSSPPGSRVGSPVQFVGGHSGPAMEHHYEDEAFHGALGLSPLTPTAAGGVWGRGDDGYLHLNEDGGTGSPTGSRPGSPVYAVPGSGRTTPTNQPTVASDTSPGKISTGSAESDFQALNHFRRQVSPLPPPPPPPAQRRTRTEAEVAADLQRRLSMLEAGDSSSYTWFTTIPHESVHGIVALDGQQINTTRGAVEPLPAAAADTRYLGSVETNGVIYPLRINAGDELFIGSLYAGANFASGTLVPTQSGIIIYHDNDLLYLGCVEEVETAAHEKQNRVSWVKLNFYDEKLGGKVLRFALAPDGLSMAVLLSSGVVYRFALSMIIFQRQTHDIKIDARFQLTLNKNIQNPSQIEDMVLLSGENPPLIISYKTQASRWSKAKYKLYAVGKHNEAKQWSHEKDMPPMMMLGKQIPKLAAVNTQQVIVYTSERIQLMHLSRHSTTTYWTVRDTFQPMEVKPAFCCPVENGNRIMCVNGSDFAFISRAQLPSLLQVTAAEQSEVDDDAGAAARGESPPVVYEGDDDPVWG